MIAESHWSASEVETHSWRATKFADETRALAAWICFLIHTVLQTLIFESNPPPWFKFRLFFTKMGSFFLSYYHLWFVLRSSHFCGTKIQIWTVRAFLLDQKSAWKRHRVQKKLGFWRPGKCASSKIHRNCTENVGKLDFLQIFSKLEEKLRDSKFNFENIGWSIPFNSRN